MVPAGPNPYSVANYYQIVNIHQAPSSPSTHLAAFHHAHSEPPVHRHSMPIVPNMAATQ